MTPRCPLCSQPLAPGDKLSLEWFAPQEWWVLQHTRNGEMWCGLADPVTQVPGLQPFTEAFRATQDRLRQESPHA